MSDPGRLRASAVPARLSTTNVDDDASLVERVRSGEERAFEVVFRRYYENLVHFALPYVHEHQHVAEDLVHDVLFRVWEQREHWNLQGSLATYLFRATRNRCIDHARHRAVEGRWRRDAAIAVAGSGDALAAFAGSSQPADADLVASELEDAIGHAVEQLPTRCRQAFLLHREHGLTYDAVAEVMGTSPKTVKAQMGRALKALRSALAPFFDA